MSTDSKILYALNHPEEFCVDGDPNRLNIKALFSFYMGDVDLGGKAQKRLNAIRKDLKKAKAAKE